MPLTFSEVQQILLSEIPNGYKLDGYKHEHRLKLKEFLLLFFSKLNNRFVTVTNNSTVNYIVCNTCKSRSIGDIFLIAKHYYPDVSLKELYLTLQELLYEDTKIDARYCVDIDKIVFDFGNGFDTILENEYGWTISSIPQD